MSEIEHTKKPHLHQNKTMNEILNFLIREDMQVALKFAKKFGVAEKRFVLF